MKSTTKNKYGHIHTIYTAEKPFETAENGLMYFKQLNIWDNSRIGRVVYSRTVKIDDSKATYPQNIFLQSKQIKK